MDTEPSIWARLYDFGWALLPYWWILAPGGIFALEPMMESFLKEGALDRLNEKWPKATRRRHFRIASIAAMFLACFLAFDDLSTKYRASQKSLNSAIGRERQQSSLVRASKYQKSGPNRNLATASQALSSKSGLKIKAALQRTHLYRRSAMLSQARNYRQPTKTIW
jgi:hypothetical protein